MHESDARDFRIIVLPDTQKYSESYPEIFRHQAEWIVKHAERLNVRMVWHLGDVVNRGAEFAEQWQRAAEAIEIIDQGKVPCLVAIGNHDYDDQIQEGRSAESFNAHFGIGRYLGKPWFGGAFDPKRSESIYATMQVGGRKYLFLLLEFGPRRAVVEWAHNVVKCNQDHDVMVVTHSFMHYHNGRTGPGDEWNPHGYKGTKGDTHDGEELWDVFLSRHRNIRWVHSGHILRDGQGVRTDNGLNGNAVHQIASNYQTCESGGNGWLRILHFQLSRGQVASTCDTHKPLFQPRRGQLLGRVRHRMGPAKHEEREPVTESFRALIFSTPTCFSKRSITPSSSY